MGFTSKLKHKLTVYQKKEFKNEIEETDYRYEPIKSVFAQIYENFNGHVQHNIANTEMSTATTTHKIRVRKKSIKPSIDTYFIDQDGTKYEVKYFQKDYKHDEFFEFMCNVVYE